MLKILLCLDGIIACVIGIQMMLYPVNCFVKKKVVFSINLLLVLGIGFVITIIIVLKKLF